MNQSDETDKLFVASVEEVLTRIGQKFKETILYHVKRRASLTLNDVADKPEEFMLPIQEILGAGAVRILEEHIANRFYSKIGLAFSPKEGHTLAEYLSEAREQLKGRTQRM